MDSKTTIKELKEKMKVFSEERDWTQFHGAKDLAIAISIEAGELLEHFRFKSEKEIELMFNNSKKKEDICNEIADILTYLVRLAQKYNIDLSDEFNKKIEISKKKYPIEKFKGSNKKYNEI
ncbi:nucleotide pyrophosphohydrolase [Candidatus Woesearchaeota archaeon]|nr:nucleotide pyrophosphohydrolase [Candidatus Woesearchaeota archaeon]